MDNDLLKTGSCLLKLPPIQKIDNRIINHKIELEEKEKEFKMEMERIKEEHAHEERSWKSCCFQLEKDSSLFFAKLSISILIIILCSYQLITLTNCNYQSLYSSILSSIITYWLNHKNK